MIHYFHISLLIPNKIFLTKMIILSSESSEDYSLTNRTKLSKKRSTIASIQKYLITETDKIIFLPIVSTW